MWRLVRMSISARLEADDSCCSCWEAALSLVEGAETTKGCSICLYQRGSGVWPNVVPARQQCLSIVRTQRVPRKCGVTSLRRTSVSLCGCTPQIRAEMQAA